MGRVSSIKFLKSKDEDSVLASCKDGVLKCKKALKKQFIKLGGRSFGTYQSKEIDKFFKCAFEATKISYFGEFAPDDEQLPISVIALGSYALSEMSVRSDIDFFISYKNVAGYNVKDIVKSYIKFLKDINLDINPLYYEIDELFDAIKDDLELKTMFYQVRYVCASKQLYKMTKDKVFELKEYKKDDFIKFHLDKLTPFDEIKLLSQKPDIKNGYGGFYDFKRVFWLLNSVDENSPKSHALKFISEKEMSELSLSVDFISSLRSALQISGGDDELKNEYLSEVSSVMQTKEKKMLSAEVLLMVKTLSSMHTIYIYSRYLAKVVFGRFFDSGLNLTQKRVLRLENGFYNINDTIYVPIHKKPKDILNLMRDLLMLPDIDLKFDIGAIFYLKRTIIQKELVEKSLSEFKKLLHRDRSFGILKALLDSELAFLLLKPMEHTRHLAQLDGYHKHSVDEYSLLALYHLENIKDNFIKSLHSDLCADGKILMKLVVLMHDAGKGLVGDHSNIGANIFRAYASKLELPQKAINMGVNLIKNHTIMNNIANTEDIYNQQVILNFISHIGEKQALKLLYILTYCISNATNDGFYNAYNAKLLRELYEIALKSFDNSDENLLDEAARRVKKENLIKKQKEFLELSKDEQNMILSISSNLLFIKYLPSEIIRIFLWAKNCSNISVDIENRNNFSVKIIAKRGWNTTMVLNKLAHLDLAYMEIFELFDSKFFIKLEYNKKAGDSEMKNMETLIIGALCDKQKALTTKPLILENEVSFDLNHSKIYAKMNINAKDQRGLMAYILGVFESFDIKVANARIQTIKNRTRNLFLIQKNENLETKYSSIINLITTKN
ncbi:nucleotidyltransferase domain-containing protein [Campylobacter fetus]|uniref:[protein-PII] uridylyltransferase family protein n=1 Tax=Campylobacter fetus TaxID=196 RepID=UPI0013D7638B|nr:nucleotidyltransferase domain-containing protein [Campylobacter fetus]